ncbi:excalibur calcium-binding domain-containing protein [Actinocrispum wychmicini]|uniref:Excalibur calcium-binding domain-containing protein n=1 Tax=Actinocrispum wychmicini TaxID=1213861 RepID=A0A4R2K3Q9_9PSEU|nr:excalibur calcium-binding domain-containing protein [Actinocrispum wychmicini]TCO64446.1 excalibur calcium-binding domain-containing protein [Actinocrispum wychmicini]
MSGRQRWHWIAAGVAGLAVVGAVLANGKTSKPPTLTAHPFPTVQFHPPENGGVIAATPTMDATTVTNTTPKPKPGPPSTQARPTAPEHTETKLTITFSLPDIPWYFDDCAIAREFGLAPIRKGEPGYRPELDGDHDGLACE